MRYRTSFQQSTVIVGENGKVNGQINAESITTGGKGYRNSKSKRKGYAGVKGKSKRTYYHKNTSG
ncbi:MAG: polymer-forming cytoskeletal protein [Ignavibacteriaceae bacterium]|nr:polymer-forming cytoskeletal protein [Ignavibacteriaceae bacterium]